MYLDILTLLKQLNKADTGNHLILTGSVGAGKSTLLTAYLKNKKHYFYITTKLTANRKTIIASINNKRMALAHFRHGFKVDTLSFYEMMRSIEQDRKKFDFIVIDEIGHIEYQIEEYIEYLAKISKDTRLVVVVRKDQCPFWNILEKLDDPVIFDLDLVYKDKFLDPPHR